MDNRAFRDALGRFATGICIVTTAPQDQAPVAMTVNSFASVSLDPPLVLWSIQNTAECYDAFMDTRHFAINVLGLEQEPLSALYARRSEHTLKPDHYRLGRTGSPLIRDALTSFECRVWAQYPGGDHQIIVGEVLEFSSKPAGKPLLFHGGRYGELR